MAKSVPNPRRVVAGSPPAAGNEAIAEVSVGGPADKIDPDVTETIIGEWTENCVRTGAIPLALLGLIPASQGAPAQVFFPMVKTVSPELIAGLLMTLGMAMKNRARGGKVTPVNVAPDVAEKLGNFPTESGTDNGQVPPPPAGK